MTDPSACQEYQPEWLLPADSEVARWFEVKNTLYPSFGEPGYVMVKQVTTIYRVSSKTVPTWLFALLSTSTHVNCKSWDVFEKFKKFATR